MSRLLLWCASTNGTQLSGFLHPTISRSSHAESVVVVCADRVARVVVCLHRKKRGTSSAVVAGPAAVYVRAAAVAVIVAVAVAVGLGVGVFFVTLLFALVAVEHAPFAELARRLLVLVKYPVMALLLSSSSAAPAQLVPLYACFVVDEFFTGRARLPLRALPFALTFFWLCVT